MDAITKTLSRPTTHYVLALLLLALAAVASHSMLVQSLSELREDSVVVNTSGRQRMLSEQTFRLAGQLVAAKRASDHAALQGPLQSSLILMRESHERLSGDVKRTHNHTKSDQALRSAYFGGTPSLDTRLGAYFSALETILAINPNARTSDQGAYDSLVRAHRDGLLRDLDKIVLLYEKKAQARLQASKDLHVSLMFGTLALLLIEAIFVFRPLIHKQAVAKEELLAARDEAQAQLTERSKVLAAVSHEIRTPLSGVLGIIDQLKHERSSVERERALDLVKDSCEALLETLDAILQQSRLGHGADGMSEKRFNPRALAQRVAELFRPMARRKALGIEVSATSDREARGDDARIQQVLANLVSNSVKFTQSGMITIFVQEPAQGSNDWAFVVTDTGTGMDEKRKKGIFEPFGYSAEDTLGRANGAGLGLSITRDIVDAMGGRIEVESELGKGTSITVIVPLSDPPKKARNEDTPTINGCVTLLIDRASDQVQVEAVCAQNGYAIYDLRMHIEVDFPVACDLTIIADSALLLEIDDCLVNASRQIIVLGDEAPNAPAAIHAKSVFVSHNQLARALGPLLKGQTA